MERFVQVCNRGLNASANKGMVMMLWGGGGMECEIRVEQIFWMNQGEILPNVVGRLRMGGKLRMV